MTEAYKIWFCIAVATVVTYAWACLGSPKKRRVAHDHREIFASILLTAAIGWYMGSRNDPATQRYLVYIQAAVLAGTAWLAMIIHMRAKES